MGGGCGSGHFYIDFDAIIECFAARRGLGGGNGFRFDCCIFLWYNLGLSAGGWEVNLLVVVMGRGSLRSGCTAIITILYAENWPTKKIDLGINMHH